MTRYVLTGTTGRLGSRILRSILEKGEIPASDLIVSASNPDRVPDVAREYGVEIRRGSYEDPSTLREAFSGADVLFLTAHPDPGINRVAFHKDAIEIAREVGVSTVIYQSMMLGGETGMDSEIGIQQGHIHTMRYLAECGMDYVIVRQGIYAEFWSNYVGNRTESTGSEEPTVLEWAVPYDFSMAWTSIDELGEANATITANYRDYIGQTLRLTGPRADKVSDVARLFEKYTGRTVKLEILGAEASYGWYDGLARGEGATVDPLLGQLLGRPARGLEEMPELFKRPMRDKSKYEATMGNVRELTEAGILGFGPADSTS